MSTWIFQANPDHYDVQGYITEFQRIYWSVGQLRLKTLPAVNDEIYLWKTYGKKRDFAGVVAHGYIVEPPTEKQNVLFPQNLGDHYWHNGLGNEISRVKVGIALNDVRPTLERGALKR